jgi:hypothetical protein
MINYHNSVYKYMYCILYYDISAESRNFEANKESQCWGMAL